MGCRDIHTQKQKRLSKKSLLMNNCKTILKCKLLKKDYFKIKIPQQLILQPFTQSLSINYFI